MSNLTVFSFEHTQIATIIIDNEIFFRATQLAELLEYQNPHDAIKTHVDKDDLAKHEVIDSMGRKQKVNFVNESGMFSLVLGSKQEKAKKVKRWVTKEVLPSIRKTGSYSQSLAHDSQFGRRTPNGIELTNMEVKRLEALCVQVRMVCGWWYQYGDAVKIFNGRVHESIKERLSEAWTRAEYFLTAYKLSSVTDKYAREFPFGAEDIDKKYYVLTNGGDQ